METSEYLPEDLVLEILLWLPVISLVRFKCVCKLWTALITNPVFIARHLDMASIRPPDLLVTVADSDFSSLFLLRKESLRWRAENLKNPSFQPEKYFNVLGSCNGVLCLQGIAERWPLVFASTLLWNPATRQHRVLPKSNFLSHPSVFQEINVGFGFDQKNNDYKVFKIAYNTIEDRLVAEVYSLALDSWRSIVIELDVGICHTNTAYCVSGEFFWSNCSAFIVSFDASKEVFQEIPLPFGDWWRTTFTFSELNGSLALITVPRARSRPFEVWTKENTGAGVTWTRRFTIDPFPRNFQPQNFWNGCQLLLYYSIPSVGCSGEVFLYDTNTKELQDQDLHICRSALFRATIFSLPILSYKESLVSV